MEPFNQNLTKFIFLSTLPATLWCHAISDWKSRVCSRCKLWIYRFVKKQRYKILVNIWGFIWRDLQFRSICWYCYCWESSWFDYYYIKLNLFHQSKHGRDVELQNAHLDLFKFPRDVMQISFCWYSRLSLREMDQKIKFGGTLSYGDSHLEFLLRHFKVFSLHAILLDAAGVMRAHSGKWPGYFYMIGWGPNSCSLGHVIGLLVCLCVKLFLPSISTLSTFEAVCLALY